MRGGELGSEVVTDFLFTGESVTAVRLLGGVSGIRQPFTCLDFDENNSAMEARY